MTNDIATANLGLNHYADSFNLVHARLISTGITNYRALLTDVGKMLRPGGVFLSMEADMQILDENYEAVTTRNEDEPVRMAGPTCMHARLDAE